MIDALWQRLRNISSNKIIVRFGIKSNERADASCINY